MSKDDPDLEKKRRIEMAYLLATAPETFNILVENNINLFHGTNANALPSILKYGMKSSKELSKMGISVSTGEEYERNLPQKDKRNFISFCNNLDIAVDYATISPKDTQKDTNFGMIIGISPDNLEPLKRCNIISTKQEIGFRAVPLEYINLIAVPESKVNFVRKLVDDKIIIAPMEIDTFEKNLHSTLFDEKEQPMKEKKDEMPKTFDSSQVKELAEGRRKFGILELYRKIKNRTNSKGIDNEYGTTEK